MFAELWPELDVISCWTDGSAAGFVPAVRERFPSVAIQPKGLLATEAFVSFPLVGYAGAALAVRSHVFEFLPVDDDDRHSPVLAHQLAVGERYEPLVTTGGGLYRYRLGDVIEVVGHLGTCPLIRFVGRAATSDLVGEKLDEPFVASALGVALGAVFGSPAGSVDALVVPDASAAPPRYVVVVPPAWLGDTSAMELAAVLDAELQANPHYAYATERRSARSARSPSRPSPASSPARRYEAVLVGRGVRVGDIKPSTLVTSPDVAADLLAARVTPAHSGG